MAEKKERERERESCVMAEKERERERSVDMSWLSVHGVRVTRLPTFRGIRLKHDYKFATDWSKVILPCATTRLITLAISYLTHVLNYTMLSYSGILCYTVFTACIPLHMRSTSCCSLPTCMINMRMFLPNSSFTMSTCL